MDPIKLAKENEELTIKMRRDLHQIPELELELPETVKYVKGKLDEWGIPHKELVNGNAVVALVEGSGDGPCIALRADMDALPVKEETNMPYKSKHEGKMHACGHDSHTAILLTCAKIINENKDALNGSVKFLFQPGEEIPGGAKPMIDEGAMENPKVDYVIGLHNGGLAKMETGKIGFKEGPLMASMDRFSIKVKGKGGHGANPQVTVDPIIISAEILLGIQKIISREISPVENGLISVCKIEGGTTQNIIPDEVNMLGTARALNEDVRDTIEKRLEEISKGIAKTYGGDAEVNYERMYPVAINDSDVTKYVKGVAEELFPGDTVYMPNPTMGGEDMAFFLQEAPGTFMFIQSLAPHEDGICYPNHNSKFNLAEETFYKGVAIMVGTVFKKLGK